MGQKQPCIYQRKSSLRQKEWHVARHESKKEAVDMKEPKGGQRDVSVKRQEHATEVTKAGPGRASQVMVGSQDLILGETGSHCLVLNRVVTGSNLLFGYCVEI